MKIDYLLILGFAGQIFFSLRFIVQWAYSEKMKKSVGPAAFWYFSIAGSSILLIYAILRKDPVFIAGQSAGMFIYFRNISLIRNEMRLKEAAVEKDPGHKAVA